VSSAYEKIKLLLLLTGNPPAAGGFLIVMRPPPGEEEISSLVLSTSGQIRNCLSFAPRSSETRPRSRPTVQTMGEREKKRRHNCSRRSPHGLFYILCRITRQPAKCRPAADTLPVKLLTSTNDVLMIGPSIPQSCQPINTHRRTRTPHNASVMTFIEGSACGFNGLLQMPFSISLSLSLFTLAIVFSDETLLPAPPPTHTHTPVCHLFFFS